VRENQFWSFLFGATMAACFLAFLIAPWMGWWLPKNVSSFGGEIDALYYVILSVTGVFFVLTEGFLVYNMCSFPAQPGHKAEYTHGNHKLEVIWTAIPAVLLLLLAFVQINTWAKVKYASQMPKEDGTPQTFEVSARQFEWRMRYPSTSRLESWKQNANLARDFEGNPHYDDVYVVNEVHTWKGHPTLVYLKTRDVLHSFYFPNLRLKQDAVPGKTIKVWFNATEANCKRDGDRWRDGYDPATGKFDSASHVWDLNCAELCGWGHYKMQGRLFVHESKEDYLAWLKHAEEENRRTSTPPSVAAH
jgi:cytochrome c oxidase subunit 2